MTDYVKDLKRYGCKEIINVFDTNWKETLADLTIPYFVVIQDCNVGGTYWRCFWPSKDDQSSGIWNAERLSHLNAATDLSSAKSGELVEIKGSTFRIEILEYCIAKLIRVD